MDRQQLLRFFNPMLFALAVFSRSALFAGSGGGAPGSEGLDLGDGDPLQIDGDPLNLG